MRIWPSSPWGSITGRNGWSNESGTDSSQATSCAGTQFSETLSVRLRRTFNSSFYTTASRSTTLCTPSGNRMMSVSGKVNLWSSSFHFPTHETGTHLVRYFKLFTRRMPGQVKMSRLNTSKLRAL